MAKLNTYLVTCIAHKKKLEVRVLAPSIAKAIEIGRGEFKGKFGKLPEEIQAERMD